MRVLFAQSDKEICSRICWTYANLTNCTDEQLLKEMIDDNTLQKIILFLDDSDMYCKLPAIRATGNILSGSDLSTKVLNSSFLTHSQNFQIESCRIQRFRAT